MEVLIAGYGESSGDRDGDTGRLVLCALAACWTPWLVTTLAQSGCFVAELAELSGSRIACRVQETLTEACAIR